MASQMNTRLSQPLIFSTGVIGNRSPSVPSSSEGLEIEFELDGVELNPEIGRVTFTTAAVNWFEFKGGFVFCPWWGGTEPVAWLATEGGAAGLETLEISGACRFVSSCW